MADEPVMLTTTDNPYNPFVQWDLWRSYDEGQGYYTCPYLARVAKTSDDLSETDQEQAILEAIDSIIATNILGTYIKVTPSYFKTNKST
jgi:hypothetical protein